MTFGRRIRNQLTKDASLGEQFRDAQRGLDVIPVMVLRKLDAVYSEPLTLGGFDRPPEAIEAIRVLDLANQEAPVGHGQVCEFVFRPNQGGARITSIDGMSIAANGGKKYRFTFRVTFEPAGGANG